MDSNIIFNYLIPLLESPPKYYIKVILPSQCLYSVSPTVLMSLYCLCPSDPLLTALPHPSHSLSLRGDHNMPAERYSFFNKLSF